MPRWLLEASIVGVGGFIGSTLRYGVGVLVRRFVHFASIPWETLTVNVVGCLGLCSQSFESQNKELNDIGRFVSRIPKNAPHHFAHEF